MGRRRLITLIVLGALLFVAVSALLARVFSANSAEQSAITSLVKAEAAGDAQQMALKIDGCERQSACRTRVATDAQRLKRAGSVSIIQLQPSTSFSLGTKVGTARVAWSAGGSLPIVQCVRVRRSGDVLSGLHVQLLEISLRIKSDSVCPRSY
ncbi:MAG: hypothetical protein JO023_28280 [Chloroflexi bacterium]|nr:hypothetical protein [Chloroflexota bacterium]